jgi:hypothetical protein
MEGVLLLDHLQRPEAEGCVCLNRIDTPTLAEHEQEIESRMLDMVEANAAMEKEVLEPEAYAVQLRAFLYRH